MFVNDYHEEATGQPYGWPVAHVFCHSCGSRNPGRLIVGFKGNTGFSPQRVAGATGQARMTIINI
jgi:hypothetical protein